MYQHEERPISSIQKMIGKIFLRNIACCELELATLFNNGLVLAIVYVNILL
jgi:hypothetical protein